MQSCVPLTSPRGSTPDTHAVFLLRDASGKTGPSDGYGLGMGPSDHQGPFLALSFRSCQGGCVSLGKSRSLSVNWAGLYKENSKTLGGWRV